MKSGIQVIRHGDLAESGYAIGPWKEPTTSAQGCRPLLEGNPHITPETPVYAELRVKGNEAAHVFLFPDRLVYPGGEVSWLWKTDYMSTPAYRNSGAGVLLIKELVKLAHGEGYNLGGIHMSGDSQKVYRALKFPVFFDIPRFVLPVRSHPFLRRFLPTALSRPLSVAGDAALGGYRSWRWRHFRTLLSGLTITETGRTDHGIHGRHGKGEIWPEIGLDSNRNARFVKNESVIAWRTTIPGRRRRYTVHVVRAHDGTVVGRFLLRHKHYGSIAGGQFRDLTVVSVMEADATDRAILVGAVLRSALEDNCVDAIEWCERRGDIQQELRKAGMVKKGAVAFCASDRLPDGVEGMLHVTGGDGDAFF